MKKINAYQCSYCSFYRKTKRVVKKHEERCFYNPKNKVCGSCKHNQLIDWDTGDMHMGDVVIYTTKIRWCMAKDKELRDVITKNTCGLWEEKKKKE